MKSEIDEMIELGVIEPSISPHFHPLYKFRKKMGQLDSELISISLTRLWNLMWNLCQIQRKLWVECQGIGSINKWICVRGIGS